MTKKNEIPNIKLDKSLVYPLIVVILIISFIFYRTEIMELPKYPTIIFLLLMSYTALDQSYEAFKRKGEGCIVDLPVGKGGHTTINPYDIKIARGYDNKLERTNSYAVFATGGFVYGNIEWKGADAFIVCPPEHIFRFDSGMVCVTALRKVKYEDLPDYVQEKLHKLDRFSIRLARIQDNIYWGLTSTFDGTATESNLIKETKIKDFQGQINYLKDIIDEYREQSRKDLESRQIIINQETSQKGGNK